MKNSQLLSFKFFSKTELPQLELDKDAINNLINNNVANKSLMTGIQKKLSLGLSSKSKRRIRLYNTKN